MNLTLGVAAHVDAGKTTLCEQMLRHAGVLRKCGRVDHGDAFMDGNALERARGITIFSEQASFDLAREDGTPLHVTLMDTPGHVDFSGEMERALSVLDSALLVVSCADGVQSHTATLFKMLRARKIPTIIVLSKMDREGADIARAMAQLQRILSPDCVYLQGDKGEVREELDMALPPHRLAFMAESFFTLMGIRYHEMCLYYLMEAPSELLSRGERFTRVEGEEVHHFRWVKFEELRGLSFYPIFLKERIFSLPDTPEFISLDSDRPSHLGIRTTN